LSIEETHLPKDQLLSTPDAAVGSKLLPDASFQIIYMLSRDKFDATELGIAFHETVDFVNHSSYYRGKP
jgi:hypothetical protein